MDVVGDAELRAAAQEAGADRCGDGMWQAEEVAEDRKGRGGVADRAQLVGDEGVATGRVPPGSHNDHELVTANLSTTTRRGSPTACVPPASHESGRVVGAGDRTRVNRRR